MSDKILELAEAVESGEVSLSPGESMDTLRKHPAYNLDTGDWASEFAKKLVTLLGGYLEGNMIHVGDLPYGLTDGVEEYVRACREVAPAVSLELMLTAGYAYAGALGGGGVWVGFNGRGTWQVTPCTVQMIGVAPSGVGKSTQQKLMNLAYKPAAELHEDAVKKIVSDWAESCDDLIKLALAADAAKLTASPDKEEAAEFDKAKKVARRLIRSIDLDVSSGVKLEYADSTAEALVSSAISFGGAAFIRSAEQDVLDNLTRYASAGTAASLSLWTDGWDGCAYSRDRKGSGYEFTSALVVSMCLMTQTESFATSFANSGAGWLNKGVLGRAWLVKAQEMDMDALLAADEARRLSGVVPVPVPAALAEGFERMALAGAPARASRLLQDRISRKAREVGGEASVYLKKALAAARGAAGGAVTIESIASSDGQAAGLAGLVLRLSPEDAGRMEDLHSWLLRCFGWVGQEDQVLAPLVTRLTYHLAKLAGIRAVLLGKFSSDDVIASEVLVDTAARLLPWLVGLHLKCLGGMVRGKAMLDVREDWLRNRGGDSSFGGQLMDVLKKVPGGVKFPISVTSLVRLACRGSYGSREYRAGVKEYLIREYEAQEVRGEPGDGYFRVKQGRVKGSIVVAGFGAGPGEMVVYPTPEGQAALMGPPGSGAGVVPLVGGASG